MTATATIHFSDGTTKELPLGGKCLELDLHAGLRQSIGINQTAMGDYKLSFTKGPIKKQS